MENYDSAQLIVEFLDNLIPKCVCVFFQIHFYKI